MFLFTETEEKQEPLLENHKYAERNICGKLSLQKYPRNLKLVLKNIRDNKDFET